MAASRYRNFVHILEKWPVDKSRGQRDLGVHLRKRIMEGFSQGEATVVNEAECNSAYNSLQRIATDFHRRKWERSRDTNVTGSSAEVLKHQLSDKGLEDLGAEGEKNLRTRIKEKLFSRTQSQ